jgi:mRNA interferase RelE/StbE
MKWSKNLAWQIRFTDTAKKQLAKLDKSVAKSITTYLREKVMPLNDAKTLGKPLTKNFSQYWRYRVGDCRVICSIENEELIIMVVRVGKRKNIYKKEINSQ